MNNEKLLVIKKHIDTMIEQTKTRAQEMLEFKMDKQMQTFSFNPPRSLVKEGKWFLGVSSFECKNFVFNITSRNNRLLVSIKCYWCSEDDEKPINELNKLKDLRSGNDIDLHVEQVRKKGILLINDYSLSSLGTFEKKT